MHSEIYRFLDSMGKWQGGLFCVDLAAEFERFIDPTEVSKAIRDVVFRLQDVLFQIPIHHDTTYADVVGQYLLFAASSLLGLVLLALLLKALDELLQKRLSKGIDRVAAGVLAMRRRDSSDGSRGRRRGRRASGGSRGDSRASSSTTSA